VASVGVTSRQEAKQPRNKKAKKLRENQERSLKKMQVDGREALPQAAEEVKEEDLEEQEVQQEVQDADQLHFLF